MAPVASIGRVVAASRRIVGLDVRTIVVPLSFFTTIYGVFDQ
jgi:hypothetical protein